MMTQRSLLFLIAFLFAGTAFGQNLDAIKNNMVKRQPQIEALWKQGLIGEGNDGFLQAKGALNPEQEKLMTQENTDRKAVYKAIATSSNSTPAKVGEQRARQISQRAASGLWLQNEKGEWYKK